ncbi:MAG: NARF domain-containing protein [Desulfococcaceae bacterium]
MKKIFLSVLFLCLLPVPAFAQEKEAGDFSGKWQLLEERHKIIAESYEARQKELDNHLKMLDVDYQQKLSNLDKRFDLNLQIVNAKQQEMEKTMALDFQKTDLRVSKTENYFALLGIITLGGLAALWISIYSYADKKAKELFEKRFDESVEKVLRKSRDELEELIMLHDMEHQLKKKKILVLSKSEADKEKISLFFKKMAFKDVAYRIFDENLEYKDYDAILINDRNKVFTTEEVDNYFKKTDPKSICFYFGPQRISLPENVASASIGMQLYGNLMNALRYQRML